MQKIIIFRGYEYLEDFIKNLPEHFDKTGEVILDARNTIKAIDAGNIVLNVKRFRQPHLLNRFIYVNFRPSKAKRSYEYAIRLRAKGFNTPQPVAYTENTHCLLLDNSSYISVQEKFDGCMQVLHNNVTEGKENLMTQFAAFTARLHQARIMHEDYSSGNILFTQNGSDYTFSLVDLNRMTFDRYIGQDQACYCFRRLYGNDEMIEFIVAEYAKRRNFNVDWCVKKTFEYRKEFWTKHHKKHPDETPYTGYR